MGKECFLIVKQRVLSVLSIYFLQSVSITLLSNFFITDLLTDIVQTKFLNLENLNLACK